MSTGNLPAFPTAGGATGISRREYAAVQIMAALISNPEIRGSNRFEVARDAVRCADALESVLNEDPQA